MRNQNTSKVNKGRRSSNSPLLNDELLKELQVLKERFAKDPRYNQESILIQLFDFIRLVYTAKTCHDDFVVTPFENISDLAIELAENGHRMFYSIGSSLSSNQEYKEKFDGLYKLIYDDLPKKLRV
ncbi:hypothetical protein E9993_17040 [Labilibacter sediminis]|nr:hypothetical protein E9993_17040 [Labilibacter sediminis]